MLEQNPLTPILIDMIFETFDKNYILDNSKAVEKICFRPM